MILCKNVSLHVQSIFHENALEAVEVALLPVGQYCLLRCVQADLFIIIAELMLEK